MKDYQCRKKASLIETGRRALFLAYVLPVLTGTGILAFLVGTTMIPHPLASETLKQPTGFRRSW